jgi:hypothetical protein
MFKYEVTNLAVPENAAHYKTAVTYARKVSGISKIEIISFVTCSENLGHRDM